MKNKKDKLQNKQVSLKPYVYEKPSISAVSIKIIILLSLQIIMLFLTKSYNAVIVVMCSTIGALMASLIHFFLFKKNNFLSLTNVIQGMSIGMLLPQTYPPLTVLFISFVTLIIFKYIFENSENFWINIISVSVLIAYFIGKSYFPDFLITSDMFKLKNPSVTLINNGVFPIYDFDSAISGFLNANLFDKIKVSIPQGLISMLWDTQSIIPAFRFNLLTIIASIVLFSDNSFSILIPSIFLLVYAALVRMFFPFISGGEFNQGDIVLAIFTSGTLFVAVFMIQWFGTHPMTVIGKVLYAAFGGILAFFIAGCGTSPIGMVYVVIICNVLNLLIRQIEESHMNAKIHKIANGSEEAVNAGD
ncbi:MAG: RnfABCDGE type electron transport complex subunit D [Treponema sp.]|nr:RnfABCDGE type electron transport complex subunit D [Treponema sp.]